MGRGWHRSGLRARQRVNLSCRRHGARDPLPDDPQAQDKLVRVISGRILDIAVDLRRSSETFGQHVAIELTADAGNQLLVPKGFRHGFATLVADCHVAYKVSTPYDAQADASISFADPDLEIDWRVDLDDAVVSDKDRIAPLLSDANSLLFD